MAPDVPEAACPEARVRYIGAAMDRLLLYHDFVSPYCRLALEPTLQVAANAGLEVRPVPFELHPSPAPLPSPGDPALERELAKAGEVARAWGTELGRLASVPRTRKAHESVSYARTQGDAATAEAVLRRLYAALWLDGLDIARLDVLADIGAAAGLDREAMHVALGLDGLEPDVVREQEAAAGAGITGVPVVQLGTAVATGLIPADELQEWIGQNR